MHRASLLVAVLLLLALASPGSAQTKPKALPDPPAEPCQVPIKADDAGAWFWMGKEEAKAGNVRCAKEAYVRSFRLMPSYDSAGNGGLHATTLGEHALACQLLSYSLAHIPESMEAPKKETARKKMADMLAESLRHVGRIRVATRVGAAITVDGEPAGSGAAEPVELCLQPGSRRIAAQLEGFKPGQVTVEVQVGPPQAVALPLEPQGAPQPDAASQPDATLKPDGASKPDAASQPAEEPSAGPAEAVAIAGLVLGGVGVITGIALLAASADRAATVDELGAALDADPAIPPNPCAAGPLVVPQCEELATASDEQRTFLSSGIAALVVGGAILVAGTVYLLLPAGDEEAQQAIRLAPLVDHRHAGVMLSGSF